MRFEYVPGFVDYVTALRAEGVKTAVVTSSNGEKMKSVYAAHAEFKQMFDAILTSEYFERSKPDPDWELKAAALFGLEPGCCGVFEDSCNGLKAGRAAGMTVVGLATTNPAEAIRPYCDRVISDFSEM